MVGFSEIDLDGLIKCLKLRNVYQKLRYKVFEVKTKYIYQIWLFTYINNARVSSDTWHIITNSLIFIKNMISYKFASEQSAFLRQKTANRHLT